MQGEKATVEQCKVSRVSVRPIAGMRCWGWDVVVTAEREHPWTGPTGLWRWRDECGVAFGLGLPVLGRGVRVELWERPAERLPVSVD